METNIEINKPSPKFQDVSIAPMHSVEHILNATMVKTFGCPRSRTAHIEKKKSKCDYELSSCPTDEQIQAVEDKVNEVINQHLPVTIEFMLKEEAKDIVDLSKLPEDASETLRIVRIGNYDACACIGLHVENTSEIDTFKIISHDYDEEKKVLRIRFKLIKQ
ncbi:alanyl-tRNA editing protein [Bacteroides nordii]|uniref:hypothetical protein n=1 Tax=Bacteroides nordii TaxID=291645 RepID=UPI00189DF752|nr:hypothetical protein [Bacteroides nordii]